MMAGRGRTYRLPQKGGADEMSTAAAVQDGEETE
jgi:hypothetical protein